MQFFQQALCPAPGARILDVGGTPANWSLVPGLEAKVTLLNVSRPGTVRSLPPTFSFVQADGTDLPFPDEAFDIAFSNSVIEHLGTLDRQQRFASEVRRVAKSLWVQAPARMFPIEPHFLAPFVHYLPLSWQRRVVRNFTGYGWLARPTPRQVAEMVAELRLPTFNEFQAWFPDCYIARERFLGFVKSLIAIRLPSE